MFPHSPEQPTPISTPESPNIVVTTDSEPYAEFFLWVIRNEFPELQNSEDVCGRILRRTPQTLPSYHGWEQVKKGRCLGGGSGFEGYFVDCPDQDALGAQLEQLGHKFLDTLSSTYRYEGRKKSQFLAALHNSDWNQEAMRFWNSVLGANLGLLRARVLLSPILQQFKLETISQVSSVSPLQVKVVGNEINYVYEVVRKPVIVGATTINSEEIRIVHAIAALCSPVAQALLKIK